MDPGKIQLDQSVGTDPIYLVVAGAALERETSQMQMVRKQASCSLLLALRSLGQAASGNNTKEL
jgi:hypothetical protein